MVERRVFLPAVGVLRPKTFASHCGHTERWAFQAAAERASGASVARLNRWNERRAFHVAAAGRRPSGNRFAQPLE
jgi:hypothetical protein